MQLGHGAQLLEQHRGDVFSLKLGNVQPGQTVVVRLTYVAELAIDGPHVEFCEFCDFCEGLPDLVHLRRRLRPPPPGLSPFVHLPLPSLSISPPAPFLPSLAPPLPTPSVSPSLFP